MPADDRAGVQDAVAADLHIIAKDGADLLAAGLDALGPIFDDDERLVALDVRRDGARAHVGLIAEDGIADVVEVRRLDIIKQHHVFQLAGVTNDGVFAHDRIAAHESALAQLSAVVDDAGAGDISAVEDLGIARDPDVLAALLVFLRRERRAELKNEISDLRQSLPRIGLTRKQRGRDRFAQVEQVLYRHHIISPGSNVRSSA